MKRLLRRGLAMAKNERRFLDPNDALWLKFAPGVELSILAEPVPGGSVHRARLKAGTTIPVHTHPADEFVAVTSGTIVTGDRRCPAGTFWITPANVEQGPHVAETDVELLTIRLGAMGSFG